MEDRTVSNTPTTGRTPRRRRRTPWWKRLLNKLWSGIRWIFRQLWRFVRWCGRMLRGSLKWIFLILIVAGILQLVLTFYGPGSQYRKNSSNNPTAIPAIATPTVQPTWVPTPIPTIQPTQTPIPTHVPTPIPTATAVPSMNSRIDVRNEETASIAGNSNVGIIQAMRISMREQPRNDSAKVKSLETCDVVTVLSEQGEWFYVQDEAGDRGYVKKCFVQRNDNVWIIFAEMTDVYSYPAYKSPTEEGALIGQRTAGEAYAILGEITNEYGEWYKIRYHLGVGFIKKADAAYYTSAEVDYYYSLKRETVQIYEDTWVYMLPGKTKVVELKAGTEVELVVGQGREGYEMILIKVDENGEQDCVGFISEEDVSRG